MEYPASDKTPLGNRLRMSPSVTLILRLIFLLIAVYCLRDLIVTARRVAHVYATNGNPCLRPSYFMDGPEWYFGMEILTIVFLCLAIIVLAVAGIKCTWKWILFALVLVGFSLLLVTDWQASCVPLPKG